MLPNSFLHSATGADHLAVQIMIRKLFETGSSDFFIGIGKVKTSTNEHDHIWLQNQYGTILDPVGASIYEKDSTYQLETKMLPSSVIYEYVTGNLEFYIKDELERKEVEKLLQTCELTFLQKVNLA